MNKNNRPGFTLVEILIVSVIVVLIIAGITVLSVQFKRSFTKGEESSVVLQETGLFLAMLRNDMINAVMDKTVSPEQWEAAMNVQAHKLVFTIFRDAEGTIEPVEYQFDWKPGAQGGSISRMQGGSRPKILVDQHIASLSWDVRSDVIPGIATGVRQIWLHLDVTLGGQGKQGTKAKIVSVSTNLFPTRLNRQINGSH